MKPSNSTHNVWNSSRILEHEYLNALINSDVLSYRVGSKADRCDCDEDEVAMTRNVVRSKSTTSVALHASAKVVRCLDNTVAFGIREWTI